MVLLKFVLILFGIYLAFWLVWRLFGKAISRALLRAVSKRMQRDMENQTRTYQQYAEGHSPFEDSVYVEDDVKVSIRRGNKQEAGKPKVNEEQIETVDWEDVP
ncbi:MAG: hypothetical protein U0176_11765 [Bacteroidia bacterium]